MYGIMSGLEPRRYADGDLVQKALQLGVQPFGMSDEEIMQAISQKQQVDDMSGASGDIGKGLSALNKNVKDYVFDYTDPLEYATLPFLAPKLAMKGKKVFDAVRGSGGALSKNIRGIGAYIGTDILARDVMGYENPFGKDAQDEAAEDLAEMQDNEFSDFEEDGGISLIDPDKPMETGMSSEDIAKEIGDKKTPFDKMKGLAAFAEFAGQLGTSPEDTPQMTGGQFIKQNPFQAPGVMRMADGGIAVPGFRKGIAAFIKDKGKETLDKGREALKKRRKKKADKAEAKKKADAKKETAISKDAPEGDSFIPPEVAYLAGKGKEILGKIPAMQNPKRVAARTALYVPPLAYAGSALLPDKPTTTTTTTDIATGGGDKDVLDADSSLRDFNYAKALERAQAAGRTEPTFVDYVASFPASYTDKLGKDPEFAKQMMAGFVAMMTPTEGIVERSGLADFAGGVMAEQARQEGEVPDQIKLLEAVKKNPELLKAMRQLNAEASDPMADANAIAQLKTLLLKDLYGEDAYEDDDVILESSTGRELTDLELLQMYKDSGGNYNTVRANIMAKAKV